MMKKYGLTFLVTLITLLSACAPIQQQEPIATTAAEEGTQLLSPENTTVQALPVTVSFVRNQSSSDAEIVTIDITGDLNYASIPVNEGAVLKALPAIDQQGNVYLLYGAHGTFFSKLGFDGSIETINVPNIGTAVDSVWIGNRLFINRESLLIVSTDMSVEEQPAINQLPDGSSGLGFMGLANDTEKSLLWVANQPLREGDKLYAFYRTYNAETGETNEEKLDIPYSSPDYNPTDNPDDRLGTVVLGVDTASEHVLLCYNQYREEENISYSFLELRDAANDEVVSSEQTCCMNNRWITSGANYISHQPVESCGSDIIRRYSDGSDVINFPDNAAVKPNLWRWHATNGAYWILMDQETLTVLDNSGTQLDAYNMPAESLRDCRAPNCISPAFLISQD